MKRRIYEAIANAGELGVNRWGIMDKAYGGDALAPESETIIRTHICLINRRIKSEGLKIRAWHTDSDGYKLYRLEQLHEAR